MHLVYTRLRDYEKAIDKKAVFYNEKASIKDLLVFIILGILQFELIILKSLKNTLNEDKESGFDVPLALWKLFFNDNKERENFIKIIDSDIVYKTQDLNNQLNSASKLYGKLENINQIINNFEAFKNVIFYKLNYFKITKQPNT